MGKTYKTALVLIPPPEIWPPIQGIRQGHDRHFVRWMPHISLLYPFRERGDWEGLYGPLARACQSIAPFDIELASFDAFQHRSSYTLWLAPEPRGAIVHLQAVLYGVVPDCDDTRQHQGGFTPHLSVGQVSGRDRRDKLLGELRAAWQTCRFCARAVSLIWRGDPPDDTFRLGQTIPLGAT
jgi:2'-5' RNA ligase